MVRWRDAWFDHEGPWSRESYPVETVGFLVRDEPEVVSIAQELLPDGEGYRAITHVPRALVDEVVTLAEEESQRRDTLDQISRRKFR